MIRLGVSNKWQALKNLIGYWFSPILYCCRCECCRCEFIRTDDMWI